MNSLMKHIDWHNPLWFGLYRVFPCESGYRGKWGFQHDHFDGDGDPRYGNLCDSLDKVFEAICEIEAELADDEAVADHPKPETAAITELAI